MAGHMGFDAYPRHGFGHLGNAVPGAAIVGGRNAACVTTAVRISYQPRTIRPKSSLDLEPVYLVSTRPGGTEFAGEWSATSTDAEGRLAGRFALRVGDDYSVQPVIDAIESPRE